MRKLLLVLAVIAVVAVLMARSRRRAQAGHGHASIRDARATEAATDQAVIARQAGQGGVGGGMGL